MKLCCLIVDEIQEGMLDCLQLLHFHIGSQISSILTIKEVMREGSHTYCELARMGAPMVIPTLYTLFLK
jgi:arginine decarboxylase